ncbi:BAPKO_0422 family outer member beta-barrel protein [Spirochaetota bacterium]
MKRTVVLLCIITILTIPAVADTGLGVVFGYPGSVGITIKLNNFPVISATWAFGDTTSIGATCDYWVVNQALSGTLLHWYLGIGAFGHFVVNAGKGEDSIGLGLRLPIGLQIFPVKQLEVYIELVPSLPLLPGIGFDINSAVGIRYHF